MFSNLCMEFHKRVDGLILTHFGDRDFLVRHKDRIEIFIYPDRHVYCFDESPIITIYLPTFDNNQSLFKYEVHKAIPKEVY